MNAHVPLNIAAVRVSKNDRTNIVSNFKGRTAVFEEMPYLGTSTKASTGDMIVQPLQKNASPKDPLGIGIHLHWELPDYFRRGRQPAEGGDVVFPQAPNRWLVIRYLSLFDTDTGKYGAVQTKGWIVESDYVSSQLTKESYVSPEPKIDPINILRPSITVPLPPNTPTNVLPFKYMGRVVDLDKWNPGSESPDNFLPWYKGPNGKSLYLTSIGFVGPSFSAYYPECSSVFGFWDHFGDCTDIYNKITNNLAIKFKVSYQVVGWINEPNSDPLTNIASLVTDQYNRYVQECASENVPVTRTPADYFVSIAVQKFRWEFRKQNITYTLNEDKTLKTLNGPERSLSGGVLQEIVWDMLSNPQTSFFLNNPANKSAPAVWTDTVKLGVGNTTVEALSALLKTDIANTTNDNDLFDRYEYLLQTLQLGLLHDLNGQGNTLIGLEEDLHTKAFSAQSGGYLWAVEQKQQPLIDPEDPDLEVNLPLDLAEQLSLLNQAQKDYDQGRAGLDTMRKQLFMDWIRYVKMWVNPNVPDPFVSLKDMTNFISTSQGGELFTVVNFGKEVGMLLYLQDPVTAEIIGLQQPSDTTSRAAAVWKQYQTMQTELAKYPLWQLRATTAMPFWMPTDPVLVMEGARLDPGRRNGAGPNISVRVSAELLNSLQFKYKNNSFTVSGSDLSGLPIIPDPTPMKSDVQAEVGEAYLLVPTLAAAVADALKAKGGSGNPAVEAYNDFVVSLNSAQGGLSPLEGGTATGLFAAVHTTKVDANPTETVSTPLALSVTFTNNVANGWPPDAVGWNTQTALPEFTPKRVDPFIPVFLIWSAQLDPMKRDSGLDYDAQNLKKYFGLDADGIDYQYKVGEVFTTNKPVRYLSAVTLSKATTYSLTNQIDNYVANYATDQKTHATLKNAKSSYQNRKIISQGLGNFNLEQTLSELIPKVTVEDIPKRRSDGITKDVNDEAIKNPIDNWYNFGFNGQAPIPIGLLPQLNFGPLRSGFAEIFSLEIVDAFGQRMQLGTSLLNPDGSLQISVAQSLKPAPGDTAHEGQIFLPPRLLAPTRLWFAWLSATHDNRVPADFVEMNSHPATTPVFGWVMPNHLDNSLFFYDADGAAIGSFGVEHNDLTYRTRAGNSNNPKDLLAVDIGEKGAPNLPVNAHLADFMWYIDGKNADFLRDLMNTIEHSSKFITPAKFAQDASLAVFIGRPLALTRAVLGLETTGNLLPLSQADTSPNDPFPLDVKNQRFKYSDRQKTSSAKLGGVEFPVRLGDLANIDDGLVGYLIETDPQQIFYSPAAPEEGANGVKRPKPDTIQLTLNATPITITMLSDPRAPVHATTGVLPVQTREIPPDQYADTVRSLAVTFFTHPMLSLREQLIVPLPQEGAYEWSWVTPGSTTPIPLQPNQGNEFATFGYTPQTLLEGWLRLATGTSKKS